MGDNVVMDAQVVSEEREGQLVGSEGRANGETDESSRNEIGDLPLVEHGGSLREEYLEEIAKDEGLKVWRA